MGRFYSIPGMRVSNSTDGPSRPPLTESLRNHPQYKRYFESVDKRGDDAKVGLPPGTPINIDGQPGVVEGEERTSGGDIVTVVRGNKSQTRRVRWGQDRKGEITIAESKRTFE